MSAAYPKRPSDLTPRQAVSLYRREKRRTAQRREAAAQAVREQVNARLAADEARLRAQVVHGKRHRHTQLGRVPIAGVLFPMGIAAQIAREAKAAPRARREA